MLEFLRLGDFLPGALVPTSAVPSLVGGLVLLCISIYSLTYTIAPYNQVSLHVLRLSLVPPSIYLFWEWGYGAHDTPANQVSVGLAVVGLYGIMRVLETSFVPFLDPDPPKWVVGGKTQPLPTDVKGRLAYTFDLATSLRGNSWFPNTYWNWAPQALVVHSPTAPLSRGTFLRRSLLSLLRQYIIVDTLDTLNKSRTWDHNGSAKHQVFPITTLPIHEQLAFSISVCAGTALAITIPYTVVSSVAILLGSPPASWPPMFDEPFTATSLADFWTRRWHAIFRRVFDRLSLLVLFIISPLLPASHPALNTNGTATDGPTTTNGTTTTNKATPTIATPTAVPATQTSTRIRRTIRAIVIFSLSAFLHIMLMYRLDHDYRLPPSHARGTFLDPSILAFFLSQPAALFIEASVILPLSKVIFPGRENTWRPRLTRAWTWAFMLWAGRLWSDVWVRRGLWDARERVVGYSVVRGILYGKWAV